MSTDNMVGDGETTLYRVRIRFSDEGEEWTRWYRPSGAPSDYFRYEEAEQEALKCWKVSDVRIQVQIVEVRMSIEPVARIEPAHVFRMKDL